MVIFHGYVSHTQPDGNYQELGFHQKKKDVFWTNKVGTIFLGDLSIKHVNVDVSNVSIGI